MKQKHFLEENINKVYPEIDKNLLRIKKQLKYLGKEKKKKNLSTTFYSPGNLPHFHFIKCKHLHVGERFSLFSFISCNLLCIALCWPAHVLIVGLYINEPLDSNKRTGTSLSENKQKFI